MIIAALNWCWIGISAFLWGYAFLHVLNRLSGYKKRELDVICALGVCALTVYAQFFSLFYKVGLVATVILFIADMMILILMHREIWEDIRSLIGNIRYLFVFAVAAVLVLILASQVIEHYDTYLYHAQSIHWIEEYGIVKGLGNLHNRLAYNSSIFCLEALFSMKFIAGRSLHNVNGFVIAALLGYTLCSFKVFKKAKIWASDCLRIAMLFFIGYSENLHVISSSGSDLLALGLVLYILTKWVSYTEDGEENMAPYAYMCILGVYALTVKLSAALIVLLVIMPAIRLIQTKKWKDIIVYLTTGIVVALPFLIRNVVISGYLIYPYPELDLFSVDWKMPAYTLLFDRNEIKAWGWGLNDVFLFDTPIQQWFPVWYGRLNTTMQRLFIINIVLVVCNIFVVVYKVWKKKDIDYPVIVVTMTACFFMWFIGSPLTRYGSAYLVILPAFAVGTLLSKLKWNKTVVRFVMLVTALFIMMPILTRVRNCDLSNRLHNPDYHSNVTIQEMALGDEIIYVPVGTDMAGYYAFPSTPYAGRIELIELRGDSLEDGFRMKEAYREAYVSTYGQVYEENIFE